MACGCNKNKLKNRKTLIKKGKKVARKPMPLITIRKRINKKSIKK